VADTDTQTVKVCVIPQRRNNIPQAIMTTVTSALFKASAAGRDIQFIVGDKNLLWLNFEKAGHSSDCLAAAIHERRRN